MALREQPTAFLAFCMAMGVATVFAGACGIKLFMGGSSSPMVLVAGSMLIGFGGSLIAGMGIFLTDRARKKAVPDGRGGWTYPNP